MAASKEERDRILHLVEAGRVTAAQAAQLLDALEEEQKPPRDRSLERQRDRTLRIRATGSQPHAHRLSVSGTLSLNLIRVALRLGSQLIPQLSTPVLEDLLQAIDHGTAGRLLDVQDLENGERLEVFVE